MPEWTQVRTRTQVVGGGGTGPQPHPTYSWQELAGLTVITEETAQSSTAPPSRGPYTPPANHRGGINDLAYVYLNPFRLIVSAGADSSVKDVIISINQDVIISTNQDVIISINQDVIISINQDVIISTNQDVIISINQDVIISIYQDVLLIRR
ncbi:hypothetical protein SARC_01400 [Sphaeroforma arctica JP610]|uniref:Uncharacterized protein n=1 Tax=Sphaeroforma arctica JP610 TaxID=667725 RepID=A0A0L0GC10_9EUKA|nr:hypothetical protein SARC_01400 [Sphaeroforma arctica JP610]KNC86444.1 hypothetical protein SARC_01400 [Sphaeroforma arctica JP610]|eukprot:XP_014160346.1 hypothetical protein SARC_01400 [Sphaeroforma arctica JP610]